MRTVMKVAIMFCVTAICNRHVCAADVQLRIRPSKEGVGMIGIVSNNSGTQLVFRDPTRGFASFQVVKLDDSSRDIYSLMNRPSSRHDPIVTVFHGESRFFDISVRDIAPRYENIRGYYWLMAWRVAGQTADFICLGLADETGNMQAPVVNSNNVNVEMYVGFVYKADKAPDVFFLFLNGSNETVAVEKPLTQTSRIVATSPAIEYTKELFISGQSSENIAIEAGEVGEWRIPWQTVHDLIPEADLAAIKAGGGDLDLVWKVGEFKSDSLPISLAEPGGAQ